MPLYLDLETRSDVPISTGGAYKYFESPHAAVLIAAWAVDDGEVQVWDWQQTAPPVLLEHIAAGGEIHAHNAGFERLGLQWLYRNKGWPDPSNVRWVCSAARAAAMGLPRSLGSLAQVLGLPEQKDTEGRRLIAKFSKPHPGRTKKAGRPVFVAPGEALDDWTLYQQYCAQDVVTERAVERYLYPLTPAEQHVWELSERINDRGIRVDLTSLRAAEAIIDDLKRGYDQQAAEITDGFVTSAGQVQRIKAWCERHGVLLESLDKETLDTLLSTDDLPASVRQLLRLRQIGGKSSTAKLVSMQERAGRDGRVRGSFLYCGATTGRWSNTGVNFNNMPRPRRCFENAAPRLDVLFRVFRTRDPDMLPLLYGPELGDPMYLLSDAVRGFVLSAPGYEFVQADYSAIEGAVIAWLADETEKLQTMHEIIRDQTSPDIYRRTAARLTGLSTDVITKKHPLRQSVGKVAELALGYNGGVAAFASMAAAYKVDLESLYAPVMAGAPPERQERAEHRYKQRYLLGDKHARTLSRNAWLACELIKTGWRSDNANITRSWRQLEDAARQALKSPGTIVEAVKTQFTVRRNFLIAKLPSGRPVYYPMPRLKDCVKVQQRMINGEWADPETMDRDEAQQKERAGTVTIIDNASPRLTAAAVDSRTRKWGRYNLYGGLLAENITQAVARDILVAGMQNVERLGYNVIAHVYDEVVAEVPWGFGDLESFERALCDLPAWANGLPLTASGWRGKRYRKD